MNLGATYHLMDLLSDTVRIPIGRPLPNYERLVLDEFLQLVFFGQEGELAIRGIGVFLGHLHREDLTAKALIDIDEKIRKDHQVKLRGQRIGLGEIEKCLLDASISACVVIKWGDNHLIAYAQSSDVSVESLREHCRSRLPAFMVPSMFIISEKLPLSANGKID
ncbi:unnamed protein product [Rotaria magnacalcarata]|uniref:AMP-binding enzyme C-terminal domain-containing protein n=1 Tax=Rotaria magnacalcarata TaxID=392030 RepID=A0A816X4A9_9BILA|nr:unnamed protein product [Rotaria magnacalcarata]